MNQETEATINTYVDISNLDKLTSYQFAVVAMNNVGESQPSPIVAAQLDEDELSPIIRATIPYQNHFLLAFQLTRWIIYMKLNMVPNLEIMPTVSGCAM